MQDKYEEFQAWLIDMDDALERFSSALPDDVRSGLDYSPESLNVLEAWLLERYEGVEQTRPRSEAKTIDGAARYVGEVFRKHLGGGWKIDYSNKKNVFFGLPQLVEMAGQEVQSCPLTLVTASTHRRVGNYIRMVFDNDMKAASAKKTPGA